MFVHVSSYPAFLHRQYFYGFLAYMTLSFSKFTIRYFFYMSSYFLLLQIYLAVLYLFKLRNFDKLINNGYLMEDYTKSHVIFACPSSLPSFLHSIFPMFNTDHFTSSHISPIFIFLPPSLLPSLYLSFTLLLFLYHCSLFFFFAF